MNTHTNKARKLWFSSFIFLIFSAESVIFSAIRTCKKFLTTWLNIFANHITIYGVGIYLIQRPFFDLYSANFVFYDYLIIILNRLFKVSQCFWFNLSPLLSGNRQYERFHVLTALTVIFCKFIWDKSLYEITNLLAFYSNCFEAVSSSVSKKFLCQVLYQPSNIGEHQMNGWPLTFLAHIRRCF